jgi:hypothetical protein
MKSWRTCSQRRLPQQDDSVLRLRRSIISKHHGGRLRPAFFAILLLFIFIVVKLDGEEHGRAQHENLERDQEYRNPFHLLNISILLSMVRCISTIYPLQQFILFDDDTRTA